MCDEFYKYHAVFFLQSDFEVRTIKILKKWIFFIFDRMVNHLTGLTLVVEMSSLIEHMEVLNLMNREGEYR